MLAAALLLSGCTAASSDDSSSVSVASGDRFTSDNASSAAGDTVGNGQIAAMTHSQFNYYDSSSKLVRNSGFGTYRVVSENPLTVKYTVNADATWSDGTAVDAADMLLAWASVVPKYNAGAVNFHSSDAGGGLALVTSVPTISDDDRSITLVYGKPFVDWETAFTIGVPAHVTYQLAYPGTSAAQAKAKVIGAIQNGDTTVLAKIAAAWSKGFDAVTMPKNTSLFLSDGAYTITGLTRSAVTLSANRAYTMGPAPKLSTIVVRYIADPLDQVKALRRGQVDILSGPATAASVQAVKKSKGLTSTVSDKAKYEHVDLTFDNGGPFDAKSYGGNETRALEVRQAFLKAIPRAELLAQLITPIQKNAVLDDSQIFLPGQKGYRESVASNGSAAYAAVDVAGAKALLAQAGVSGPITVRLAYADDDARRVREFQLIQSSAKAAGFDVEDGGTSDAAFLAKLGSGGYDASIFAWQLETTGATESEAQFRSSEDPTGGNYNGYSNAQSDADWEKIEVEPDAEVRTRLLQEVDANAWGDAYGVTLYQLPDLTAHTGAVSHVIDSPLPPDVFWNSAEWTVR